MSMRKGRQSEVKLGQGETALGRKVEGELSGGSADGLKWRVGVNWSPRSPL